MEVILLRLSNEKIIKENLVWDGLFATSGVHYNQRCQGIGYYKPTGLKMTYPLAGSTYSHHNWHMLFQKHITSSSSCLLLPWVPLVSCADPAIISLRSGHISAQNLSNPSCLTRGKGTISSKALYVSPQYFSAPWLTFSPFFVSDFISSYCPYSRKYRSHYDTLASILLFKA